MPSLQSFLRPRQYQDGGMAYPGGSSTFNEGPLGIIGAGSGTGTTLGSMMHGVTGAPYTGAGNSGMPSATVNPTPVGNQGMTPLSGSGTTGGISLGAPGATPIAGLPADFAQQWGSWSPGQQWQALNLRGAANATDPAYAWVLQNQFHGDQGTMNNWINGNETAGRLWRRDNAQQYGSNGQNSPFYQYLRSIAGGDLNSPGMQGSAGGFTDATVGGNPHTPPSGGAPGTTGADPLALNVNSFLNPNLAFTMKQATDQIQNSAASRGNLQSGSTLKGLADYTTGKANAAWGDAVQNAMADRGFRTGVDTNDRNFFYNAARDDRNFNYGTLQDLARFGMQGTQSAADVQRWLATLLSNNALTGGQVNASGTVGGNNAVNQAIQQFIQQYLGNNLMSRVFNPGQ
jgi:hypothetical protein